MKDLTETVKTILKEKPDARDDDFHLIGYVYKAINPFLYQSFKSAEEIAKVINRSRSYVFKALKDRFTEQEIKMLKRSIERREE